MKSTKSERRRENRIYKRIPILAEIVKDLLIEDITRYFNDNPGCNVLVNEGYKSYEFTSPPDSISSLYIDPDSYTIKYKTGRVYTAKFGSIDKNISDLSILDIYGVCIEEDFIRNLISQETLYNIDVLNSHILMFIKKLLSKRKLFMTIADALKILGLPRECVSSSTVLDHSFPSSYTVEILREQEEGEELSFIRGFQISAGKDVDIFIPPIYAIKIACT